MTESNDRARYIETLKLERGGIAMRPQTAATRQRLAEIDRVLDTYADEPVKPARETAAEAPPSSRRPARKSTSKN